MAAVPPSSSMRNAADDLWLAGVDGCRTGWVAAFAPAVGERRPGTDRGALCRRARRAGGAERRRGRYSDRPAGARGPRRQGGRECRAAASRRATVFGVFGPVAGGACGRGLWRGLPDRVRQLGAAAQGIEAAVHAGAENPRGRRVAARLCGFGRARVFEVHPEVAFWRLNGERALHEPKKVKGRCYEPGTCLAAKPARRRRLCRASW